MKRYYDSRYLVPKSKFLLKTQVIVTIHYCTKGWIFFQKVEEDFTILISVLEILRIKTLRLSLKLKGTQRSPPMWDGCNIVKV